MGNRLKLTHRCVSFRISVAISREDCADRFPAGSTQTFDTPDPRRDLAVLGVTLG